MLYAEITIKISVDESKLTAEQQEQAKKGDVDVTVEHPLENGVDDLRNTIENIALARFEYLGNGIKAIKIETEE